MRWKPRNFRRPGSRRAREHDAMVRLGLRHSDIAPLVLKELYPPCEGQERPWWAKLAYDRGWITWPEYYKVPLEKPSKPLKTWHQALFEKSPFIGLIRKGAA